MSVAIFMSGSGTNAVKVLELERRLAEDEGTPPFSVAAICSDNSRSNANNIGKQFGVPVFVHDLDAFAGFFDTVRSDVSVRPQYFHVVLESLGAKGIKPDLIVLAGYMVIATSPLLDALVVNVHPADLSVRDNEGRAVYTGAHAVRDAVLERRSEIRASTHLVTAQVDQGPVLFVSAPVKLSIPEGLDNADGEAVNGVTAFHQERLKQAGDWAILPLTVLEISHGSFATDGNGVMHYHCMPIPRGYDASLGVTFDAK